MHKISSVNTTGDLVLGQAFVRGPGAVTQRSPSHQFKTFLKKLAYLSGGLGLYHRIRNQRKLTVAMFHRVLPRTDTRWAGADPEWTMSTETFADCLRFFKQHYHPVSMQQLAAAQAGTAPLPARSLLITFDDGWADTAEYAQPILDRLGLSALVFVAGSVVGQAAPFWQESVYHLLAAHTDGMSTLRRALNHCGIHISLRQQEARTEQDIRAVIGELEDCDKMLLQELASLLQIGSNDPPAMMTAAQLRQMSAARHGIGSHGMTHQPLTKVDDPEREVASAKAFLSQCLGGLAVDTMSFPHGAYDKTVVAACRATGYQYLFSSDALLNEVGRAGKASKILGRIHISERAITDVEGRFHPFMLATWLFLRPSSTLHMD
ncbi:MAG: polysaccharide deacetylase family protein [Pseudomonadota bacterium]